MFPYTRTAQVKTYIEYVGVREQVELSWIKKKTVWKQL